MSKVITSVTTSLDGYVVGPDDRAGQGLRMGSTQVKRSVRPVADDRDWSHGSGPEVRGPMREPLLVCAGRARVATDLTGDGLELLGERSA